MDSQLHLHAGLADPKSLRPSLPHSKSAPRVTSDPEKKAPVEKHKSSHRHHHRHESRHSSSRRHAAKEAVQSAIQIQPPTSFGDLLKQARGSKDPSPGHSRKGSVAPGREDGSVNGKERGAVGIEIPPRGPLRVEDVESEAKRVAIRERELRNALESLSDKSLKTSRRLDDTYYSILEKVSTLRQTIGTLQELSGLTRELHENFESDMTELVEDMAGQTDAFEGLQAQEQQVSTLEERIKAGRDRADALTTRLAQARERVDARAKAEAEWEAAHIRRLRIFWGAFTCIAAVTLTLMLFRHFKPVHADQGPKTTLDFASRAKIIDAPIPDLAKEAIIGPTRSTASESLESSFARPLLEDDERLRLFDEL